MLPDLSLLLALILGLASLAPGPVDPLLAVGGTAGVVAVACALCLLAADRALRALDEDQELLALASARWTGLWPLLGWLAALQFFDWGTFVAQVTSRWWWLGLYVFLFLPAALLFAVGWASRARVERAFAMRRGATVLPPTGAAAIRQALRRNGIALAPMGVLLGLLDGIWILGELGVPGVRAASRWIEALPLLSIGVMLLVLGLLSFFLPALFRRVLRTEPLPPGPLRTLLERHAQALGLRYRDLVLWKTGGRVLNAMVVGFTPGTRTIFLTDGLLEHLPEEEVLAVFAHEAGHARRHHLPLFLVIFFASAVLFQVGAGLLEDRGLSGMWMVALHLLFLWFVLLGSISRFFEREADAYGSDHATDVVEAAPPLVIPGLRTPLPAGAARMIRALERIRRLSGRSASHRHGTIEERVRHVAAYATDVDVRERLRRSRRHLVVGVGVAVVAAGLVAAWRAPGDVALARAQLRAEDAGALYAEAFDLEHRRGGAAEAQARWAAAREGFAAVVGALEGRGDVPARRLAVEARFNEADTVLHGLRDEAEARRLLLGMLEAADASGLDPESLATLRFQALVDLARIRVHEGDVEGARADRRRAAGLPLPTAPEVDRYLRRRLELLDAVIEGGRGDVETARRTLGQLATGTEDATQWVELRDDARRELERLPHGG